MVAIMLLLAGVAGGVVAPPHAKASTPLVFTSTLTPHTGITTGTRMVLRGHGAMSRELYSCKFEIIKGSSVWVSTSLSSLATADGSGNITCVRTFRPYYARSLSGSGRLHRCPLTSADRLAGYRCALTLAAPFNVSLSKAYFTTR